MIRVSKGVYMACILGGYLLAGALLGVGTAMTVGVTDASQLGPAFSVMALGAIPGIFGAVMFFILLHKCWKLIQDGHASTTPGKAVGFLFIPLFNLYWIFRAFFGYAKDYNAYIERHTLTTEKLSENLFLTYCVLTLAAIIPFLGWVAAAVNVVVFIIMLSRMIDSANNLPEPKMEARAVA